MKTFVALLSVGSYSLSNSATSCQSPAAERPHRFLLAMLRAFSALSV
jgi:hypothetical protein